MNDISSPALWDDLVSTALLGTTRRPLPESRTREEGHAEPPDRTISRTGTRGSPTPPKDAPSALLDAAATETLRRRAGLLPGPAAPPLPISPADPRPPLPAPAARRLTLLLTDRTQPGGRRGAAPDLMELLPQWLAAANAHGYAPPPQSLPALLDAARGRTDLRPSALEFAGPRALWLARLNPDWRFALRATAGRSGAAGPGGDRAGPAAVAGGPVRRAGDPAHRPAHTRRRRGT